MPRALPLFALALLAGCTGLGPETHPSIGLPGQFRNAATSGVSIQTDLWWSAFGDPVLDSLIAEALRGNLDIETARARLEKARAGVRFSEAQLGPAAVASGEAGIAHLSREDPSLGVATRFPGFERTQERYAVNAGASWEIDLFGRLHARRRAAEADLGAAEAGLAATRLAVSSELAVRYVTLRMLQQRQLVAVARIDDLEQTAGLVGLLVERGVAPRRDFDSVSAELSLNRSRLAVIEAGIEDQLGRIGILTAKTSDGLREIFATPLAVPRMAPFTLDYAPVDLLRRRPDVVVAEQNLEAADARLAATRADRFPRLSIGGLIGLISGNPGALFGSGAAIASGAGRVEQVLFDSGRTGSAEDAARAERSTADAQYRKAVSTGFAEVETAWFALARARDRVAHLSEAEAHASAVRKSVEEAYVRGARSLIDLLSADRQLLDVREARIEAEYGAADAIIALFRAIGGGWEKPVWG